MLDSQISDHLPTIQIFKTIIFWRENQFDLNFHAKITSEYFNNNFVRIFNFYFEIRLERFLQNFEFWRQKWTKLHM